MAKHRHDLRRWTNEEVAEMRASYRSGMSSKAIAAKVKSRGETVRCALLGITYRDVSDPIKMAEIRRGGQAQQVNGGRWYGGDYLADGEPI